MIKVKSLFKKNLNQFFKNKTIVTGFKFTANSNLLYSVNDATHLYNYPFKDGKEFVLLQSRWREIFSNYRKTEVPKPRTATIGHFGSDTIKTNLNINFND